MAVYQNKKTKKWFYRTYKNDIYGNRKQYYKSGFDTKKEAQNAERIFLLLEEKEEDKIKEISFNELYEEFLSFKSSKLKIQSIRAIKNRFETNINPYFKDLLIKNITAKKIINWQNEIIAKGYSHEYKSALHTALVGILNYAIKFHGLKDNIASKIGNFKDNGIKKEMQFWTYEEFNKFISNVDDIVYKTLFETMFYTGARIGEVLALTWKDITDSYIDINKTISRTTTDGKRVVNSPKTRKSKRIIQIDVDLSQKLNKLKKYYKNVTCFNNNWFVFGGIKPLSTSSITRKKNESSQLAKVKQIRLHDFRHSHASMLLSEKVPITVISKRLGHSDISMTLNTYSHMLESDEDKAVEILNKIKENN